MEIQKNVGVIVEILLDKYVIKTDKSDLPLIVATIRGNIKKKKKILVGDMVKYAKSYDSWIIEDIIPRINSLIRPPVANIYQMLLIVSLDNPKPDYLLLDKEIILCLSNNIKPIIAISKIDLLNKETQKELDYIKTVYASLNIDVILFSSNEDININLIAKILVGKITALSGNSGVGKSSLVKKIINSENIDIEIGDISTKSNKGKHTTKHVKLYSIDNCENTYILDTPGFSSYELYDIEYKELKKYYPDFLKHSCKYLDCTHTNENISECMVKKAVETGNIDLKRYERYVYIYEKLKEQDNKKYK